MASQIPLRNNSQDVEGKNSIYVILVKVKYMQSSTYFSEGFYWSCETFASHQEELSPWILILFQRGDTRIRLKKQTPGASLMAQ